MTVQLFPFHCPPLMAERLVGLSGQPCGQVEYRHFPDWESYLRVPNPPVSNSVAVVCSLDRPDPKLVPLLFLASVLRKRGATKVGLISPYLCYLRQDQAFRDGEAVSARLFAQLVSEHFDWLVTVEPHLHRLASLDEVYSVSNKAVMATASIAKWIGAHVERPILIGPDRESGAWIRRIAEIVEAPYMVLSKIRSGDRTVNVEFGEGSIPTDRTPVIVDDVSSSGATLVAAIDRLRAMGTADPACVVVHPVFSGDSFSVLTARRPRMIVSCNTIAHPSNGIDVTAEVWEGVSAAMR